MPTNILERYLRTRRAVAGVLGMLCLLAASPALAGFQTPAEDAPDLSGNWIRGDFAGLGQSDQSVTDEMLTVVGQRRFKAYDFLTDDPAYGCVPASWTRVWSNPNVVVQFTQADDEVRVRYEWMDIDRRLPLVDPEDAAAARVEIEGIPTLGRSIAWYDGDTLVIDTIDYAPSYITTIANLAGLPQSQTMHTVERISRDGDVLAIEITHLDSTIFRQPFVMKVNYAPTEYELLEYGCSPEEASIVAPN